MRVETVDPELSALRRALVAAAGEAVHVKMGRRDDDEVEEIIVFRGDSECAVPVKLSLAAEQESCSVRLRQRQSLSYMREILRRVPAGRARHRVVPEVVGQAERLQVVGDPVCEYPLSTLSRV